jgi:hypothetical protein
LSDPIVSLRTYDITERTRPFTTAAGAWPSDLDEVVIIRNIPAVAMIHKEEDVKEAKETENGNSDDSDETDDDNAASAVTGARFAPVVAVFISMLVGVGMLLN